MFGRSAQPTVHLLIGNVGPGVGFQRDAIAAALAPLGCSQVHVPELPDREAAYVFATFQSGQQATAALNALHERPCDRLGGRTLTAKFAKLKAKANVRSVAFKSTSCWRFSKSWFARLAQDCAATDGMYREGSCHC